MGLISKTAKIIKENRLDDAYKFDVAGFFAYQNDARGLYELNPQYKSPKDISKTYYKYKYFEKPCDLIPEPKNEFDKNAVAVYCQGLKIGYVPADMCDTVKKCIKKNYSAKVSIRPGIYREFDPDEDEFIAYKKDAYAFVELARPSK